jgi:glycerol-3-phosphate dehydrogenase subunit C
MPAWETGDLETVRKQAANNLDVLMPFVEAGQGGRHQPDLRDDDAARVPGAAPEALRPRRAEARRAVRDPSSSCGRSATSPASTPTSSRRRPAPVAYHAPCHLRAQAVGFKGRDLLRKIPGVKPKPPWSAAGTTAPTR